MTRISLKWTALALAGFMAAATGAQAGGIFDNDNDNDDNGYSSGYNGQSHRQYCRENPYDDDCSQYNGGYRRSTTRSHMTITAAPRSFAPSASAIW
jgi:hypothetical protein